MEMGTARPRTRIGSYWSKAAGMVCGRFSRCRAGVPEACRTRRTPGRRPARMQKVSVSDLLSSSHSRNPYVCPGFCAFAIRTTPVRDVTVRRQHDPRKAPLWVMELRGNRIHGYARLGAAQCKANASQGFAARRLGSPFGRLEKVPASFAGATIHGAGAPCRLAQNTI
jgi:hypothetical protein